MTLHHVHDRNALGNSHDEGDLGVDGFKDGVARKRGRHVNRCRICARLLDRLFDGVENRDAQMLRSAFTGCHATDHLRAIGNRLLGMKCALGAGKTLADHFGVTVDEDGHLIALSGSLKS